MGSDLSTVKDLVGNGSPHPGCSLPSSDHHPVARKMKGQPNPRSKGRLYKEEDKDIDGNKGYGDIGGGFGGILVVKGDQRSSSEITLTPCLFKRVTVTPIPSTGAPLCLMV